MRTVVITSVAGRHEHLRRMRRALMTADTPPEVHVVVTMGDATAGTIAAQIPGPLCICHLPVETAGLPLAAARNTGARLSGEDPEDLLIFLDVDCIPSRELVAGYRQAAEEFPGEILCGPVAYLPETDLEGSTDAELATLADPHPARPTPAPGFTEPGQNYDLFWSLSFAVSRRVFDSLGGFDEQYTGYGAEDTDLARRVEQSGIPLRWVGSARAFHQHHPVSDPPVEHLDDILTNGRRYAARWGHWPMRGWLEAFAARGLVTRRLMTQDTPSPGLADTGAGDTAEDWVRTVRVASVPSSHVYIRHLAPPEDEDDGVVVRLPDPPPAREDPPTGAPWWPPRLLDPEAVEELAADVFHVHFGFDAEDPARLGQFTTALRTRGIPLVYTVHDLQNPHHSDTALHQAQMTVLLEAASAVITLSDRAAEILHARWGVTAEVIAHPHVVDLPLISDYGSRQLRRADEFRLGLHLKSLRQNMAAVPVLVAAAHAVAEIPGGVLQVNVHTDVYQPDGARYDPELVAALDELASDGLAVDLRVHDYFSDAELFDYLASLHASLLPYRFGTHSGWLEACHDLGTTVIAPNVGCYASQGAEFIYRWNSGVLDTASLRSAVRSAAEAAGVDTPQQAVARQQARWQQRRDIARRHEEIYREVLG
ncbi:glycosyltransferase [Nesterenkonia alba]|uniref:glycosyltransferase n=1 Tax=Nesterenkonia alba TaxID=515814 RepID=UPI0003B6B1E1|nr:glycosyltransferase [Nesterenkonia alba]